MYSTKTIGTSRLELSGQALVAAHDQGGVLGRKIGVESEPGGNPGEVAISCNSIYIITHVL